MPLVARHGFVNLPSLLDRALAAPNPRGLAELLESSSVRGPDLRTIQAVMYNHKPIKVEAARDVVLAIQETMRLNGDLEEKEKIDFSTQIFECNSYIPELGNHLSEKNRQAGDSDADPFGHLASLVECDRQVVSTMSAGKYVLVPRKFADRVAHHAATVLGLSQPLKIRTCEANELNLRPIGNDSDKEPTKGKSSGQVRGLLIESLRQIW